jgi:hypothetical protein
MKLPYIASESMKINDLDYGDSDPLRPLLPFPRIGAPLSDDPLRKRLLRKNTQVVPQIPKILSSTVFASNSRIAIQMSISI